MTIAPAPVCVGASSSKRCMLPTQHRYYQEIVRYFSREEGPLSEMCFDSGDKLGMEDEDLYDPLYEPEAGIQNKL